MPVLTADCPRCGSKRMTFDVEAANGRGVDRQVDWISIWEVFSVCRECRRATPFVLRLAKYDARNLFSPNSGTGPFHKFEGSLNTLFKVMGHVTLKDERRIDPPDHLPEDLERVFSEGAACLAIGAVNAAATMFRLCVDLATEPLLPKVVEGEQVTPERRTRRDLGLRLPWLFDNGLLPKELSELASAIKEDGNDGAHRASLSEADAEDILDFTVALLERLITEPVRLAEATERRAKRRQAATT